MMPWLRQGRRSLFSAKMAQAEDRESLLSMLRRSLFSAKIVLFFLMVILFFWNCFQKLHFLIELTFFNRSSAFGAMKDERDEKRAVRIFPDKPFFILWRIGQQTALQLQILQKWAMFANVSCSAYCALISLFSPFRSSFFSAKSVAFILQKACFCGATAWRTRG